MNRSQSTMNSVFQRLAVTCATLICTAAAEPVGQTAAPEAAPPAEPAAPPRAGQPEAVAFLGVITGQPPRIMSEQLGIKPGEGLVVAALAPEGPSSRAGVAVNDLIISVDDVVLRGPLDLTKIIRQRAPGDTVLLKLIRKGEPSEIRVTLGTRPAGQLRNQELERIMRKLMDERAASDTQLREVARLAGKSLQNGKDANTIELPTGASIRVVDGNGCVELKTTGERREVVVKDKEDKIVWSGPWNSEEDKKAAPPEVSRRFKELDIESIFESSRIRLTLPGGKPQEK